MYRVLEHKAQKIHQCIWCGERINAGEKYKAESCMFEGDFNYNKYHPECYAAAQKDFEINGDCALFPGENPRPTEEKGSK